MPLDAEEAREAWRVIGLFHADPSQALPCPRCQAAGVAVFDRSARPHAEWYALVCQSCGLDETLHRSMPSPYMGLD